MVPFKKLEMKEETLSLYERIKSILQDIDNKTQDEFLGFCALFL